MSFIKSQQIVLKAVRDVGEKAGKGVEPHLPCCTRFATYISMARSFYKKAQIYASALGGWDVQQWAQERVNETPVFGHAVSANDDDIAMLADSDSELELDDEDIIDSSYEQNTNSQREIESEEN